MEDLKSRISKCPNCGAPVTGDTCEYCDTIFSPDKESKTIIVNNYYGSSAKDEIRSNAGFVAVGGSGSATSPRSKTLTLVLAILLGYFGAHRFYAGKIGSGVAYLLTFGIFGIGWIIDSICSALSKFRDKDERLISIW
mgnify:CR=1 FL=1